MDGERIGCIGLSLGGHNSLSVAAFDEKVKAAVSSSGFDSFHDYMGGNLSAWCQRCYMPRIASVYGKDPKKLPFDFPEVLAAIAPRALYVHAPLQDSDFKVDSVRRCVEVATAVYRLLDAERNIAAVYPPGGHGFPTDAREADNGQGAQKEERQKNGGQKDGKEGREEEVAVERGTGPAAV